MHEARKKRQLSSLRCEKIKGTDCAKLSTQHCLGLGPVSDKACRGRRRRKIKQKQTLSNSEIHPVYH